MPCYHDSLWGEISLDEPVIVSLVQSEPVQRLRGIAQAGASAYLSPVEAPATRFDHSLGLMHVLATLNASLPERIAGLLHDVPHTAFSHTIDAAFPSAEYNFHEQYHRQVITNSEIPQILSNHEIDLQVALDPALFPLLEQPLPLICADRIDYTLRDRHASGHVTGSEAREYLSNLIPTSQGILHPDIESALWFATHFVEANRTSWTGPREAGAYWALGNAIRRAVELGLLTMGQLFATDAEVLGRLREMGDPEVSAFLRLIEQGTCFYPAVEGGPYFHAHMKQRVIDPLVWQPGTLDPQHLSALSSAYSQMLASIPPTGRVTYRLWSDRMPSVLAQNYRAMSPPWMAN